MKRREDPRLSKFRGNAVPVGVRAQIGAHPRERDANVLGCEFAEQVADSPGGRKSRSVTVPASRTLQWAGQKQEHDGSEGELRDLASRASFIRHGRLRRAAVDDKSPVDRR